ncbi:MAG TPA: HAMP domain-containing sensor histidine kinase [Dehalococcoidia bacterium]|nr:HAMP domain-containing sensor histidine kinase [Dehalococcoidia bacterium]
MSAALVTGIFIGVLLALATLLVAVVRFLRSGPKQRTLPVRGWLGLGLLAILLSPVLATVGSAAVVHVLAQRELTDSQAFERVRPLVERGVARWTDPAWQAELQRRAATVGVDVELTDAAGNSVYRSSGDPLAPAGGADGRSITRAVLTFTVAAPGGGRNLVRLYSYPLPALKGETALASTLRSELSPLIILGALALALLLVAQAIRPAMLTPLHALSQASREIAAGNLDVSVPRSHVREVNEAAIAFTAMGAALRGSLVRQAELEQERRLFITAVAHDLRTPLFALRGYLEGLEQGIASTPEKAAQYIRVCQEKADALERLIADLFTYTRLEYLEQEPQRERLEFGAVVARAVDALRPRAEEKGVAQLLDGPGWPVRLDADAHLLGRALGNLLENAIRFTPPGGEVRLRWREGAGRLVFSVADTGPGIPPQDLPRLFDPLFRGESSRNRQTGGAGLGLTIAQRILTAHGGELTAANGAAGGAVFTGTLPLAEAGSRAVPPVATPAGA